MTTDAVLNTRGARWVLAVEAVFPVAVQQAYLWLLPHERPRWLDVVFGVVVGAIIVVYVGRRGLFGWRIFGLAWGSDHRRAAGPVGVFTLAAVGALLLWGWRTGGLRQDWDVLGALLLYPLWGLVQQCIMFGIVYPRLRLLVGVRTGVILTAVLFAAAHTPNPLLMGGGALMVLVFGIVWERTPSLPVLALSHGVIGAVCDKALHVSMRVGAHFLDM
ncbi:MAG: CPBP family intramembrane metalloprotease [Phycisphaerae bacterium]|nr:CPBP family intramembrane metalloprotease [Phycisphaerae bacterium]